MKENIIFILQFDEGGIVAASKEEIDHEIKYHEERGSELNFKTIGSIKQPPQGISPDFDPRLIEFFDKKQDLKKEFLDQVIIAIVNHII